jgi:hypothetical protein
MARGKYRILRDRAQCNLAPLEASSPMTASHGYPNTPEKQDSNLKSGIMKRIGAFKEDIRNPLKEIQENTGKQVEILKKETNKYIKEIQENAIKQMKEFNKIVQ